MTIQDVFACSLETTKVAAEAVELGSMFFVVVILKPSTRFEANATAEAFKRLELEAVTLVNSFNMTCQVVGA